jgi:hypothetical protein
MLERHKLRKLIQTAYSLKSKTSDSLRRQELDNIITSIQLRLNDKRNVTNKKDMRLMYKDAKRRLKRLERNRQNAGTHEKHR